MEEIRRQMIRNRKLYPFLQDPSPKERISQIPEDEIIKDFEVTEEGWVIERICALQKDGSVLPLDVKETSLNEFLAQELPHVVTINKEGVQLHVCVPDESQPNGYFISTSEMPQGWQPSPENPAVLVPSGKVEAFVKGHFAEKDGDKGYKGKGPKGTVLVQGPALSLGQEENVSKSGIVERA